MKSKHFIGFTGGSGFIGSALLLNSEFNKYNLKVFVRTRMPLNEHLFVHSKLEPSFDYGDAFDNVKTFIHIAARVHVMKEIVDDPLSDCLSINTLATLNLARQAAAAGVKRFIFISSVKVNGESSDIGNPFRFNDVHKPVDPYGISKSEAELALHRLALDTEMELVIIRPTLVYGPGVKANFASLMNLVSKGIPLPFGCITQNKRSLVSVTNLVDLIITCIDHPKAANQTFLVSDDHDVSTSEIVHEMAKALDKPSMQLPIPIWCYKLAGKIFNKSDVVERLTGSLQVDISHTKQTLGWKPPQTLQEGFKQTAQAFLQAKTK
ncbi:UDP-glucose 4-epimerase family protein [Shewanella baltica]|uniref:UDP-glucose 4-epimerase family protein n=1 Tax=Shewanella baltica TaxID=62322 RepID=UPI00217EF392|nr:SDR family oxidoreductase [Shewanella baltica]